ncbi:MAG TPA: HAD-IIA family hydrolase [Thermoleophilaceae bacterium]|nr:HAD-IIA family hydrolase [Thermoleophilaceae bacterium]
MSLAPVVAPYDQLIVDLDGCVWVGDRPIDGSVEAIERLRSAGKRVAFVTNNSRATAEDYVRKLWSMGIQASLGDVVTVGGATQHLLAETRRGMTAFVIGTQALLDHVADAGLRVMNNTDLATRAELVVVGGTEQITYDDIKTAALALRRGADFLATSRDPTYPMPDGFWPGTGALLAAVETASGREAAIIGKPEPQLFLTALDRLGEGHTLVVGDRLGSDVEAAHRAHLDAALVLTGDTSAEEAAAAREPRPVAVAESLLALVTRA